MNQYNNTLLTRELRFAYKLRQALNESADALPASRLEQLAAARKAALRAQKVPKPAAQWAQSPVLATLGGAGKSSSGGFGSGFGRMGVAFSLVLIVGSCVVGLFQVEQQRRIEEIADLDSAVLTDELPISAYADHGFNAFIKQQSQ